MRSRRLWTALVLLTAFFVQPMFAQERTLVITTLSDISTLDPHVGYDTLSWPVSSLFYAVLGSV